MPYDPQKVRLTRYLKELTIDIVNDPVFPERSILFESNADDVEVTLDPSLFRRAVQNIIINALVHNSQQTKVEIKVGTASNDTVCILICDDGLGIAEAEQAQLFHRYYRGTNTDECSEGSGLGLAIAKQIIGLHGGEISVKSEQGKGTEFAILIPRCSN
jgi:signal transduction histidine kinase